MENDNRFEVKIRTADFNPHNTLEVVYKASGTRGKWVSIPKESGVRYFKVNNAKNILHTARDFASQFKTEQDVINHFRFLESRGVFFRINFEEIVVKT